MTEFQERDKALQNAGYVALRPKHFFREPDRKAFSWGDYINAKLSVEVAATADSESSMEPVLFASGGGEDFTGVEKIGTPGLGYIKWGVNNKLPNVISMLTLMQVFTASGWDFVAKLLAGNGFRPMYSYTQYVGGNITHKSIPYNDAGTLLNGRIAELENRVAQEKLQSEDGGESITPDGEAKKESALEKELAKLKADYATWENTKAELDEFLEYNNLTQTCIDMAGDMAMMTQCFCEFELQDSYLVYVNNHDERAPREGSKDGRTTMRVPTSNWKPKIIGIRHRSNLSTRLERKDKNGRINFAYYNDAWLDDVWHNNTTSHEAVAVPFLDPQKPLKDLRDNIARIRSRKLKRECNYAMTCRFTTPGRPYYSEAAWHSLFGGSIYEYAFTIVDDRLTRKHNKNVIGSVIYVHQQYLQKLHQQQDKGSGKIKTIPELQEEVFDDISSWMMEKKNSGQPLISSVFTGADGKDRKAWEIVEIESKSNSAAQADKTELQEISSIIFFTMGVDSKLIGNTPGDVGSSGGTDLRERYLVKNIQFAPLQKLLLQPLYVISKFNEWDEHLTWEIERLTLTTLDRSKTGVTTSEGE